MASIKDENFVVLQAFMVKEFGLKGNELLIYGIIYGFSQTEGTEFSGGLQYLTEWTNSTKQGVIKSLKSLVEKGLIEKEEKMLNGVRICSYKVNETKFNGGKQSLTGGGKQSLIGGKQSLPNNKNIYKNYIYKEEKEIYKEKESRKDLETEFNELWSLYPRKIGKQNALKSYITARQNGSTYQEVKDGILAYAEYIKKNKTGEKYIKHGSTWFNQKGWLDEYGDKAPEMDEDTKELLRLMNGGE